MPQTQIVKTATMHIRYHFSPGLIPDISHLKVSLNGTLFATLPVTMRPAYAVQGLGQSDAGAEAAAYAGVTQDEQCCS